MIISNFIQDRGADSNEFDWLLGKLIWISVIILGSIAFTKLLRKVYYSSANGRSYFDNDCTSKLEI